MTIRKPKKAIQSQGGAPLSIEELAVYFNFKPTNAALFAEAFTHSSYANEHNMISNERLEFLGDSVLSLIVCNFLYQQYCNYDEGELAKLKAIMVSTPYLAAFAKNLELDKFIKLGQGERRTGGINKQNILADLFEAFIGAYFLNFGLDATNEFVIPLIRSALPEIISQYDLIDAKSNLQEIAQAQGAKLEYRTIKEDGPPHKKLFTVEVLLNNEVFGCGIGHTLKEAQNNAAVIGLTKLRNN